MMVRFSLIVATVDRTRELILLLDSLAIQTFPDFEVIIVDQNKDGRVVDLLTSWKAKQTVRCQSGPSMPVQHLCCDAGVSRARNLGLGQSSGMIVAFPDDDCWYPADLLENVNRWFEGHKEYNILSVGCRDEEGRVSSNRWWQEECDLRWINIFRTSGTCCFFVERPDRGIPMLFDNALGPGAGTDFGCGEDSDFLLVLMRQGLRGRFYSHIHVGHPCKDGFVNAERAARYGGGFGGVLAKHGNPLLCVGLVLFDFSRAFMSILAGNRNKALRLWTHGRAMIKAYHTMYKLQKARVSAAGS